MTEKKKKHRWLGKRRTMQIWCALAVALVPLHGNDAQAVMYRCVENGKVRFTDMPVSSSCKVMDLGEDVTVYISGSKMLQGASIRQMPVDMKRSYEDYINLYGVRYNVDPHLIRAVIRTESGFDPKAVSKKGAQGLMQLMPDTARELLVKDPFDPQQNIEGGTRYLRSLLTTFKEDKQLALAAYNAGPTIVKREQSIPSYPETIQYVKRVLKYYQEYKNGRA